MADDTLTVDVPANRIDVSVLIVTWNSERWIARCLRSIAASSPGVTCEVVVCDNGSRDATLELVRGLFGETFAGQPTHLIALPSNEGFAAGTNRAFSQSSGRYVFLLNPDCELQDESLTKLVHFLDERDDVSAAAPLLHDDEGNVQREFQLRRLPTFGMLAAELLLVSKAFPGNRATSRYRYRDLELHEPVRIEQPAAAALLVRRETMLEVGPLDERFSPAWFEDVDLCRRFAAHAKRVCLVPVAHVTHSGGSSLEHMDFGEFSAIWYRNMWRYAQKWLGRGETEALRWFMIVGMILRSVAAVAGLRPEGVGLGAALRAYSAVLKGAFDRWDSSSQSSS